MEDLSWLFRWFHQPSSTLAEGTEVLKMEHFELIRRMVEVEKLSRREVARRLGHSRKTIEKALQNAAPVPYTLTCQ